MFGELAAIDRKPRCATVIAIQDSVLVCTPADAFCAVLKRNPQVAMATLCRLVDLVRALSSRVFEFSTLNVPCRNPYGIASARP